MKPEEMIKRMNAGIQYRAMQMEVEEDKSETPSYRVTGYASTFNQEYILGENDEIRLIEKVDRNAFDNADESDVIMQYDHAGHVYARIANGTLELSEDEHGKRIDAYLGGTEEGRKLYEEIKGGYTNKMSFGFTVDEWKQEERHGTDGKLEIVQTVARIGRLYDVSAVSLPANDFTAISARSRFDAEVEKRMAEANEEAERIAKEKEEAEKAAKEKEEAEALDREMRERERLRALALL